MSVENAAPSTTGDSGEGTGEVEGVEGLEGEAPASGAPVPRKPSQDQAARLNGETKGAPATTPEKKAEAERRKYLLKVDGEEIEEELGDDEIAVRLQKARAADKRMQEAADLRREMREALAALKKDPYGVYKQLYDGDLEEMTKQRLIEKYKESQLSEPEREKLALQRRIEAFEAQDKERQELARQEAQTKMEEHAYQTTKAEFKEALSKLTVPVNQSTLYMMAEVAKSALMNGLTLTPSQLAAEVEGQIRETQKNLFAGLSGENLAKFLGPDVVKELIKHEVARVRAARAVPQPAAPRAPVVGNVFKDEDDAPRKKKTIGSADARKFFKDY